jgi:hypothetical protein
MTKRGRICGPFALVDAGMKKMTGQPQAKDKIASLAVAEEVAVLAKRRLTTLLSLGGAGARGPQPRTVEESTSISAGSVTRDRISGKS